MPAQSEQQLTNKNIFIFPSLFGFVFLSFILLLFLLGTNYQNNIILLLSYLLVSFFVSSMLQSFFNLSGIKLTATSQAKGFANQPIDLHFKISNRKRRFNYYFNFPAQKQVLYADISSGEHIFTVPYIVNERGIYDPGRLKVSSYFAFGLFVTWTHLNFKQKVTVYPEPLAFELSNKQYLVTGSEKLDKASSIIYQGDIKPGVDEFLELKSYQRGESYSHVAWKQLAKGQGWLSKKYHEQESQPHCLALKHMPAINIEQKLQQLCFLIIEYNRIGQAYSIDLYGRLIELGSGEQHLNTCLTMLADFDTRYAMAPNLTKQSTAVKV